MAAREPEPRERRVPGAADASADSEVDGSSEGPEVITTDEEFEVDSVLASDGGGFHVLVLDCK